MFSAWQVILFSIFSFPVKLASIKEHINNVVIVLSGVLLHRHNES